MSMLPSRRKQPWVLLNNSVPFASEADLQSEWKELKCLSKKAYECGEYGDSLIGELLLLASVVRPPGLSSLFVSASPRVIKGSSRDGLCGRVVATDRELVVIVARFEKKFTCYLIYNSDELSLTMIPYDLLRCPCTASPDADAFPPCSCLSSLPSMGASPVPVRRGPRADPVLVFLWESKRDREPQNIPRQGAEPESDVTYSVRLFPLAQPALAASSRASSSGSGSAMHLIVRTAVFPRATFFTRELSPCAELLLIHDAFSWEGKCFWVDLLWGALFCDHHDLFASDNPDKVQFQFIPLPPEHRLHLHGNPAPSRRSIKKNRMMACVGGSIKFVSIEMNFEDYSTFGRVCSLLPEPENRRVTIWALLPGTWQWVKDSEFRMKDLWQHKDFERQKLPKSPWGPRYPILSPKEGILYMMIDDLEEDYTTDDGLYIICIHMCKDKILSLSSQPLTPPFLDLEQEPELAPSRLFRCSRPISIEHLVSSPAVRKGAVASGHGFVSNQALPSILS